MKGGYSLLSCFTGSRWEDVIQVINGHLIKGDDVLNFLQGLLIFLDPDLGFIHELSIVLHIFLVLIVHQSCAFILGHWNLQGISEPSTKPALATLAL